MKLATLDFETDPFLGPGAQAKGARQMTFVTNIYLNKEQCSWLKRLLEQTIEQNQKLVQVDLIKQDNSYATQIHHELTKALRGLP